MAKFTYGPNGERDHKPLVVMEKTVLQHVVELTERHELQVKRISTLESQVRRLAFIALLTWCLVVFLLVSQL